MKFLVVAAVLLGVLVPVPTSLAEEENTPEHRASLIAKKKFAEAFAAYRSALEKDPKNPSLLYNTGLTAYLSGKAKEAITYWSKLKAIEPNQWQVRAKLIQAYEAAGQRKERDAERTALYKLRQRSDEDELKNLKFYVRDQFAVGEKKIMVFEYFDLKGDRPIRFSFDLLDASGKKVAARYSLGSDKQTNDIALELKQIKPGERLFHLDGYKEGGRVHETYELFTGEPDYDKVKAAVKEILQGKRKPRSQSKGE